MLVSLALLAITLGPTISQAQTGCVPNTLDYPCVYVANQGTNSVLAINASTNDVIATIPVGVSPMALALTPDNAFVYVANSSGIVGAPSVIGRAASVGVLGSSAVNNVGSTVIAGDLDVFPGPTITGFPPGVVYGNINIVNVPAREAFDDATTAYNNLAALGCTQDITTGELGGLVLGPGVYCFDTTQAADLRGVLTLDFHGTNNADVVFQVPAGDFGSGSLTTEPGSSVVVTNPGQNDNVYWQVQGAVSVGVSSRLVGTILSEGSNGMTLNQFATIAPGRAMLLNTGTSGPVIMMNSNTVSNCAGTVSVIDTASNTVSATVPLLSCPTQIAITPDGKFAYVVEASAIVEIIDTRSNQVVDQINLKSGGASEQNPTAITFTPDGSFAYVADTCTTDSAPNQCAEKVSTASPHTITVISNASGMANEPASIATTPDGTLVCLSYVDANFNLNVAFISTTSNTIVTSLALLNNAVTSNYGFGITPEGILYVAEQQSFDGLTKYNTVARVDTKVPRALSPAITVGNGPTGVAVGPNGALVYVTNEADNTLSVINTTTLAVFTQAAFNNPQGVAAMSESPPTITTQPASQTIGYGQPAMLTVVATSPSPLSYQWYQGQSGDLRMPISGATSSSYTTPSLTLTTSYWVLVSNIAGSIPSNTATITVTQPFITSQPANQTIAFQQTATLSITATGVSPLSYQWYQGQSGDTSMPIVGATSSSFTTPSLTLTTDYWVLVRNSSAAVNSSTATVMVTQPIITSQPASQTITAMQTATLSITATGVSPLSYQWYQGQSGITSMPISGATSSSYTTPALITTTSYWVLVRNSIGSIQSNTAVISTQASAASCGAIMLGQTSPPPLFPATVEASVKCTDPQGEALTTTIDWGDGSTSSLPEQSSLAITFQHSYAAAGFYTLKVSAINTSGFQSQSVQAFLNLLQPETPLFAGQTANLTITTGVTIQPSFTLQFTCTNVIDSNGNVRPASELGITCTSSPPRFTQLPVTLIITTTGGASGSVASEFRRRTWLYALWLPIWSLAFCSSGLRVAGRRKHVSQYLGLCTAIMVVVLFVSCSSGGFSVPETPPPPPGSGVGSATPSGTYQLTVVDQVAPPGNSTGFEQTTLIVPLTVSPTQ
jgi:YVTN family beta-propeller protein